MIFNIIGLAIGIMILVAGIYYFVKEKSDKDSRKIYGITMAVGALIMVFIIVKLVV